MEVKKNLIQYLREHRISAYDLARKMDIHPGKLSQDSSLDLNAEELCEICSYLGVDPYSFYMRKLSTAALKESEGESVEKIEKKVSL